jgi:hypothetical protein
MNWLNVRLSATETPSSLDILRPQLTSHCNACKSQSYVVQTEICRHGCLGNMYLLKDIDKRSPLCALALRRASSAADHRTSQSANRNLGARLAK